MTDKKSWMHTVSETVDKATKAVAEAWDGTAEVRQDAWEKTKEAVRTTSDALDEGVEKVKAAYKDGSVDNSDAEDLVEVDAEVGVAVELDDSDIADATAASDDADESEAS